MFQMSIRPASAVAAAPAIAATAGEYSSDEILIERIAAGDKLAMQVLFARHRTTIYRWLLRFVGNETVAEDLLSDVFLDVWQQAGRYEGRAAVTTWLLSIARFKALSTRRRRTDDRSLPGDPRHRLVCRRCSSNLAGVPRVDGKSAGARRTVFRNNAIERMANAARERGWRALCVGSGAPLWRGVARIAASSNASSIFEFGEHPQK